MASGIPSLPLIYNCVGISHLWILETVSGFDIVNDPVNASKGSNNRVWLSLSLSFSFLISSTKALPVSIPVKISRREINPYPYVRSLGLLISYHLCFDSK
jgi:hypothetical protein